MMLMKRRDFLKAGAAAGAMASLYGCAGGGKASGHVVVVGGGYGGATVAVAAAPRSPSTCACGAKAACR